MSYDYIGPVKYKLLDQKWDDDMGKQNYPEKNEQL
jgi:hypothetical protein